MAFKPFREINTVYFWNAINIYKGIIRELVETIHIISTGFETKPCIFFFLPQIFFVGIVNIYYKTMFKIIAINKLQCMLWNTFVMNFEILFKKKIENKKLNWTKKIWDADLIFLIIQILCVNSRRKPMYWESIRV